MSPSLMYYIDPEPRARGAWREAGGVRQRDGDPDRAEPEERGGAGQAEGGPGRGRAAARDGPGQPQAEAQRRHRRPRRPDRPAQQG